MESVPLGSHSESFQPMIYDMDSSGRISLRSLFNYMQGTADLHSRSLGTSLRDFALEGYTWVYARYFLRIIRYPESYKPLTVETWRSRSSGMMALREFRIIDKNGPLALATSWLALIDRITRKPVPIPDNIVQQFAGYLGRAIDIEPEPLRWQDEGDTGESCIVRYSDLDVNGHVNNAAYLDYLMEGMNEQVINEKKLQEIQIDYRAEALHRNIIESRIKPVGENKYQHSLKRLSDNKTICMALTTWR